MDFRRNEPALAGFTDALSHLEPQNDRSATTTSPNADNPSDCKSSNTAKVQAIYRARRARDRVFGENADLFGEPAWDVLLDLYVARQTDIIVSIGSAVIASAAPPTTGLRWVHTLAEKGLIDRIADPYDKRRSLVRISDEAVKIIDKWLKAM